MGVVMEAFFVGLIVLAWIYSPVIDEKLSSFINDMIVKFFGEK